MGNCEWICSRTKKSWRAMGTAAFLGTAELAEHFADKFQSAVWGKALGLAHDAGKGRMEWQTYIRHKSGYGYDEEARLERKSGKIPHAIYGTKLAEK